MNFKYRPDIDGLRAIAVLAVIIYHADFTININEFIFYLLPGGYLGVDIFYVISGYLITFLIISEFKAKKFHFFNFYERRIRRLFPALFVVVTSTLIAGYLLMMPNQYKDLSGSAISSLLFLSNFWFYFTDSYFADSSALKPLLHTWSLSIEEQFYLIFPPILIILLKKNKNLIKFFFIIIFFSLIFATYGSYNFKDLNFYIIFSRIWEIALGSLIAYLHIIKKKIPSIRGKKYICYLGFGLIIISFFIFNKNTLHPSILTSFTIIGTGLILYFNNKDNMIYKILSSRPFVGIGLISYSLYLWHFPIFAFKKIKSQSISDFDKIESILLIVFLSILSYFFIEKPFRKKNYIKSKNFFIFILIFFFSLISLSSYIFIKDGLPQRYSTEILNYIDFNYKYKKEYQTGTCHLEIKEKDNKIFFEKCKISINDEKKNIYLWGDSLAAHLYSGIKYKYNKNFNVWHRSVAACKPFIIKKNANQNDINCNKINKFILNEIIDLKPDKVFISNFWFKKDLSYLQFLINKLKTNNINNIYLVGPSIRWSEPLPKILLKYYRIHRKIPKYLSDDNHKKNYELDSLFHKFSIKNNINYISLIGILCKKDYTCMVKVGPEKDAIVTWDENHFTKKASEFVFSKFLDK